MAAPGPLRSEQLAWRCNVAELPFETTAQLDDLTTMLGQDRAMSALRFGVGMRRDGYNIYVLGSPGQGKRTAIDNCLKAHAEGEPAPDDWCYINNFEDPQRPRALRLPPGRGVKFRGALSELIEELKTAVPAALESDEFRGRVQQLTRELEEQQEDEFGQLAKRAEERGIKLVRTPGGFAMAPVHDGEVLGPEEFEKLSDEQRKQVEADVAELQEELEAIIHHVPQRRKQTRDQIKALTREVTAGVIGQSMALLKEKFQDLPEVGSYLDDLEHDILEHTGKFQDSEEEPLVQLGLRASRRGLNDYQVNLLVDNSETTGAPVVFEDHPTYHNLIGRVEHQTQLGALITDFTLIRPGALHRANGGYLVVEVLQLLQQPYAWQGLTRALKARAVRMESLGQALSLVSTVGLEPEPVPLDVKVILLGNRSLFYLLYQHEPEFAKLFKVAADFEEEIDRTVENQQLYTQLVATQARAQQLRPLDRGAMGRVLEHCARLAGDAHKLVTHMRSVVDLLREADYWANRDDAEVVGRSHVQRAIDEQQFRAGRIRERVLEQIKNRTVMIDTDGAQVAQVNGLAVLDLGNSTFGRPSRITATARLGKGEVVDIERESELGGSLHSKGVMILSSLLASRYAKRRPLSLSASLVFEQSYGRVDGDSASLGEFCVLLSAPAEIPLKQSLAVTGSINQLGRVQPIGGVNEKIEGFFDVCLEGGLNGRQGVLIPAANVRHLMLREDVVEAARQGQFHVYAVQDVDEAIELLTGLAAGEPDQDGSYPADSVNGRVEARLETLSRLREAASNATRAKAENDDE